MTKPIISINAVGKKYIIGSGESYITLRDSLTSVFKRKKNHKDFWALKDISFDIKPGESWGIIGRNGAGKSTLLKVLSQITPPTTGKITMRGRVASLLEVGTGFHQELTGRENIYLNGAILGMTHAEIKSKFDEIVDFSGIEQFLDTPVKRYSSGMYVRLAFAVAAHLEPEILIIDEVLAVGDTEFQKKCLDKMEEVTKKDGRTILFVSHNLLTVQSLCKKSVLLERGHLKTLGDTAKVIDMYLNDRSSQEAAKAETVHLHTNSLADIRFTSIKVSNANNSSAIRSHDPLQFAMDYDSSLQKPINEARVVISVMSERTGALVLRLDSDVVNKSFKSSLKPQGQIVCETDAIDLSEGKYSVDVDFLIQGTSQDFVKAATTFEVQTDINPYDFRIYPDNTVSDRVIKYKFKQ